VSEDHVNHFALRLLLAKMDQLPAGHAKIWHSADKAANVIWWKLGRPALGGGTRRAFAPEGEFPCRLA
jgi:hypothetical protein